ncbi:AAA family ATPase [Streptomyces sp. NPDC021020]|uniref:helix-turn-helix transcriptional regulator n=1 Tax=Streptomyces sp. NPDC021020 TaxID=3365109 RepID=UPI00378E9C6F
MRPLPPQTAALRSAELVGRQAEMDRVAAVLAAARAGRGGALVVTGEPGAGKTRLAAEALAAATAAGLATARGGISAVSPPVPYRPLIEALLSLTRTAPLPSPAALGPYARVLAALLPSLDLRQEPAPPREGPAAEWDTLPGAGPRGVPGAVPEAVRRVRPDGGRGAGADAPREEAAELGGLDGPLLVGEAVLRVLAEAGRRRRGCLVVLDDLHDADLRTLAVVEYLLDNLADQPVAVLLTTGLLAGPAADLSARACQRGTAAGVDLAPLRTPDVRRLVAAESGVAPTEVEAALLDRVLATGSGNPFLIRELTREAVSPAARGRCTGAVPPAVASSVARRVDRLPAGGREVLGLAALFGCRFPLPVLRRTAGRGGHDVAAVLRAATSSYLLEPDPEQPDWYAFRHPLAARAVRDALAPAERTGRARQAAAVLAELHPGLPGEWCARAAELCAHAGDTTEAARLSCEAGRRALAEGTVERAVALLSAAHRPAGAGTPTALRATVLELLLYAAGCAARFDLLPELTDGVAALDGQGLPPGRRAALWAALAELTALAGRPAEALHQLDVARRLLGESPAAGDAAAVEAAAARVEPHRLAPDRLRTAEHAARRALVAARSAGAPQTECRALVQLGRLTAHAGDPAAAGHLLTACALAREHRLPAERVTAELALALDTARHDGDWAAVEAARREALHIGVLPPAYEAGFALALEEIRRGDFSAAGDRIAAASRDRLGRALPLLHLADAVRHAHLGRRAALTEALDRLAPLMAETPGVRAMAYGLARAHCSLLEEERATAEQELAQAVAYDMENPAAVDIGRHGLVLLLGALAGRVGPQHCARPADTGDRWHRPFADLAHAVLLGREGRTAEASAAARAALTAAAPYPPARHLALRLVAPAAYDDGWGDPVTWLREAEEHFHAAGIPAVAAACRGLLRGMGAQVRQRRTGIEGVPAALRRHGVTVREFEVARLLAARIGNKDIAGRLHISPRTVEKHVASLLRKTGHPDRAAFASAADFPR